MHGLTDSEGKQLDYGTGMARSSVNRGIAELIKLGIVICDTDNRAGSSYEINLDVDIDKVVAQSDWYRKATKSGSAKRPPVVAQSDTQKQEEIKRKKDIAPAVADSSSSSKKKNDDEPMNLEEFVKSCRGSPNRHIQIIGEYADERSRKFRTAGQWRQWLSRHLRPANRLAKFSDEQISDAVDRIKKDLKTPGNPKGFITKWGMETIEKYLE
jgi:hypothetical protein